MKRNVARIALVVGGVVAAAGIVLVGGTAIAERMGPGAMRHRMHAVMKGAVEAARPDDAQRKALVGVRDKAMQQMRSLHEGRRGEMREALALFEGDTLDAKRLEQMKAARLIEMTKAGDVVVAALTEAHDVLRPEQRQAVVEYLKANKPSQEPGLRGKMMKRMATARIDSFLDDIKASNPQRAAIEAARDHVFAAFDENVATVEAGLFDKALTLFSADKVDAAQIAAMRADHQARAGRIGDAVVQAIHDVHDALTPAQRVQVTDEIRERMARFGRHHGHGAGSAPVDASGE